MSHTLYIDASIRGDYSTSRAIGKEYMKALSEKYPDVPVVHIDIAANPPPHLEMDAIMAGFTPEESRTPEQTAKNNYRLELIEKFKTAKSIVLTTPMFNWNVPSGVKAMIDQLVYPGVFDATTKSLAGIPVTIIIASGGNYGEGSGHESRDFESKYLEMLFGAVFGSTDVKVIRSEHGYAGFGVTELAEAQAKSQADATAAAIARAKEI